jgi:hypothetical protein
VRAKRRRLGAALGLASALGAALATAGCAGGDGDTDRYCEIYTGRIQTAGQGVEGDDSEDPAVLGDLAQALEDAREAAPAGLKDALGDAHEVMDAFAGATASGDTSKLDNVDWDRLDRAMASITTRSTELCGTDDGGASPSSPAVPSEGETGGS